MSSIRDFTRPVHMWTRRGWGLGWQWPLVVLWLGLLGSVSAEDDRVRFVPLSEREGRPRGRAITIGRLRLARYPRVNVRAEE